MATDKWLFGSITELGTNALASLANSTSDTTGIFLSAAIDNSTLLYKYIQFELNLGAPGAAYSAGAYIGLYAIPRHDGTNYVDGTDIARLGNLQLAQIPLSPTTGAHRVASLIADIPSENFKVLAVNKSGQALHATTASLKYRLLTEQSV